MNTFVNSLRNEKTYTDNGMLAHRNTGNACVDLFFKAGASRGKDITRIFSAAMAEEKEVALRIAQWLRDVRGGAGERQLFRDTLLNLELTDPKSALRLIPKIPTIGRWDDLLIFKTAIVKTAAFRLIRDALVREDGLCAKWMPRKGIEAAELRAFLGMSPKRYRKTLVNLTNVVETQMCSNDWDEINYEHVPSLASARYKKAFERHGAHFEEYVKAAVKGEAKVNASAVYPHDVLKTIITGNGVSHTELDHIRAQWAALPNFIGDSSVFSMVDVSASMTWNAISPGLYPLDVAISLGLYTADKNTGPFKDCFATFSSNPEIMNLRGDIVSKVQQMARSNWSGSTNIIRAFEKMLQMAVIGNARPEDMPEIMVIFSDMQFDRCASFNMTALDAIAMRYMQAGYKLPKVVFWNLDPHDNSPAKQNTQGVALVSGFSPAIMKTVLKGNVERFTPRGIMLETVMVPRYNL